MLAIGTSVDYSVHIAYAYLIEPIPEKKKRKYDTPEKIRRFKAQTALSKMGSSVFHGGFSTFLAISVLAPAKTYIFLVFYRLWFGIILFGMTNGFLFLPVLLSLFGPTQDVANPEAAEEEIMEEEHEDTDSLASEASRDPGRDSLSDLSSLYAPSPANHNSQLISMMKGNKFDSVGPISYRSKADST